MSCSSSSVLQPSGLIEEAFLHASKLSSSHQFDARWANGESRIAELLSSIQPNKHSELQRKDIADYVSGLVRNCLGCEVFMFGSVPLKTYLPDGDIDLTAFSRHQELKDSWALDVQTILEYESQKRDAQFTVSNVQCIHAEVKIVKCVVNTVVVDISFNQLGGLCTLCFLEEVDRLIQKEHFFKQSIILVKAWCYYESRILGAHHALLSTYALETLVLYVFNVFFPMLRGPLEVLFTFLDYFSKFDWEKYCVSLWGPVPLAALPDLTAEPPLKEGSKLLLNKEFLKACSALYDVFPKGGDTQTRVFTKKNLNIIDPLRMNNNLGRSVSQANFHRIKSAFRLGASQLAKLFEVVDKDFPNRLDGFFSNTRERHQHGHCPDAPASFFPPYEHLIYERECLYMLNEGGTRCSYTSQERTAKSNTGMHEEDIGMETPDQASEEGRDLTFFKGFPHANENQAYQCNDGTSCLTCPGDNEMLEKTLCTQLTPTHGMQLTVGKDHPARSFLEQSALERENMTRPNAKVMKNGHLLQDLEESISSFQQEDNSQQSSAERCSTEIGQDVRMSNAETAISDLSHLFPLKENSNIPPIMQGGSVGDIGFGRTKSWPVSNIYKNSKRLAPSPVTSSNIRIQRSSSASEDLEACDTAMQKPPHFLFPGSPDLFKSLNMCSDPSTLQSASSSVAGTSSSPHHLNLSQAGEKAKDSAHTSSFQGNPSHRFTENLQGSSENVQCFASCTPQLHKPTFKASIKQLPSSNKKSPTLCKASKGEDGSNDPVGGVSVTSNVPVTSGPQLSEGLSRANKIDEKIQLPMEECLKTDHLSRGRVNLHQDTEVVTLSVDSLCMNPDSCLHPPISHSSDNRLPNKISKSMPTYVTSWHDASPSTKSMSDASIPVISEALSCRGHIEKQPFFQPANLGTPVKPSFAGEVGNGIGQGSASFCSSSGAIPMLPYYNTPYSAFPLNNFSPLILHEDESFLDGVLRESYPHNYHSLGQIPESIAAALSARFASLSAEENGMEPHRDLLRSDLADHLRNLEFGRWCQEPAPQTLEQSSMFYGNQDPSMWGVSSCIPFHSSFNQVVGNTNGSIPMLFASQNVGGILPAVSNPGIRDANHLRKQGREMGTFFPASDSIHREGWQHDQGSMEKKTHFYSPNYASSAPVVVATAPRHGRFLPFTAKQLQFGSLRPVDITNLQCNSMGLKQSDQIKTGNSSSNSFLPSLKPHNNKKVIFHDKKRQ